MYLDILNIAFIVTTFYKKRNQKLAEEDPETYKNKINYISLDYLKEEAIKSKEEGNDWFLLDNLPDFSLEKVDIFIF